jgi:hypothetical protein
MNTDAPIDDIGRKRTNGPRRFADLTSRREGRWKLSRVVAGLENPPAGDELVHSGGEPPRQPLEEGERAGGQDLPLDVPGRQHT